MLSNNLQLKHSEIFILQIFHFFIIASSGFKLIVIFWLVYEYELWSCEYCKHIYRKRQNPKAEKWKQIIIVGVVSSIYQNHPNPKAEKCRKCIILGVVSSIYRNHQNPKAEKWKKKYISRCREQHWRHHQNPQDVWHEKHCSRFTGRFRHCYQQRQKQTSCWK